MAHPEGVLRPPNKQQQIDIECGGLLLFHFSTCPFCIKVRHEMAKLSLPIMLRDTQHDWQHRADLLQIGGKNQTPYLQLGDGQGNVRWLFESNDIIHYLRQRFARK